MSQETTTQGTEVIDITTTYKLKGQLFARKQRVSSFLTKHPEGTYVIHTRKGQATVSNGQIDSTSTYNGTISTRSLVDKAYKMD